MLGQFLVEPELEPEPELELDPDELELEELEPVFEVLELDDGVVVDVLVLALEPVVPVVDGVLEVVAASATTAPPARRPVVSAPNANALRRRTFMVVALSSLLLRPPVRAGITTVRLGAVAWSKTAAARRLRLPTIA
jgi:hypothetical protein